MCEFSLRVQYLCRRRRKPIGTDWNEVIGCELWHRRQASDIHASWQSSALRRNNLKLSSYRNLALQCLYIFYSSMICIKWSSWQLPTGCHQSFLSLVCLPFVSYLHLHYFLLAIYKIKSTDILIPWINFSKQEIQFILCLALLYPQLQSIIGLIPPVLN